MDPPAVFLCANNLQSFGSMASEENTISSVPPQSENASTDQVHSSIDYKLCDTKHPGTISSANEAATARDTLLNDTEPDINNYRSYGDAYYRYVRFYVNGWAWSILSWFFAANSLLAIALVLAGMNEEYLSTWTHQITINTVMAILSQLGSTLLMVPLAEAISQLKWLWFYRQSKLLRDFDDFDRASRGPWFSFLLIWKTRASLVSFGALLMVVNFGWQPFVQQAISYTQSLVPVAETYVTAVQNITADALQDNSPLNPNSYGTVPPDTVSAIYAGLNGGVTLSDLAPPCTTANCSWGEYDSLAICASPVANLTHLLTGTAITKGSDCSVWGATSTHVCNYSLPNGAYLTGQDMYLNLTSIVFNELGFTQGGQATVNSSAYPGTQSLASISFPNVPVLLDFFMIYYSPITNNVAAVEGALSFCGQTYNTSVQNGQVSTVVIDTWSGLNTTHEYDNPPMWELEGYYTVPLWVSPVYSYSLSRTLAGIFTGYHSINDANNDVFSTVAVQALSNSLNGSSNDPATLSLFLDEVAVSISNNLRNGTGGMLIPGSEYSVETSVVILWAWLLLPLFLVAFTFVFLLATIWTNHHRRVKTWRSTSLAVLSGLSPEAREQLGGLTTRLDLKETARKSRVRLVEEGGVWKLVAE